MVDERGERIPLTIADWDRDRGSVSIVFNTVGTTTRKLADLQAGDSILSFSGPLGLPTEVDKFGTVIAVTGDGSSGECGFITEPLEKVLQDEPEEARPGSSVNSHRHWPGKWRSRQKH